MARYPKAEWVPWKYLDPGGRATYFKGQNKPIAVVMHIMEGYLRTARQWAEEGHFGASWHFSVGRDGTVLQHLEFNDGGYHAGITVEQAHSNPPIWPLYKGPGRNVNHYTIGIEHEGFHNQPWTEPQKEASRELCRWLAVELDIPLTPLYFPPHAVIDVVNRVNDFAPAYERARLYQYLLAKEDEVTQAEYDRLVARIVELERRTGATPPNAQRAHNADLLLYADGLNTAIWKNIAAIDELRSLVADLSPSSTVAVADALELAANKLRGIDRHVNGDGENA